MSEVAVISRPLNTNPSSSGSVLIIDDEAEIRESLQTLLELEGFDVETAVSGEEGLVRIGEHPYDLVLLDLTMPFMDGEETLRRLREIRSDVSVVLCAVFIEQEKLDRLMSAGLAGYLRKPLAPDEIVSHVRSTLQSLKYSGDNAPGDVSAAV